MDKLAEKLIQNHKNPITKLNIDGTKLSTPGGSEEERNRVESALNTLGAVLSTERVERRCNRSKCKWLHVEGIGQVTKVVGSLTQNYGYQNKDGVFLKPEEVLFLLEMNKIELVWNDVPMSIQQAYSVILKDNAAINNYRTYRNLKLVGYKLHKYEKQLKRELEEKDEPESKRSCLETAAQAASSSIFQDAPILIQNTETAEWDYKVRYPESTKKDDEAFYLHINKSNTFDECLRFTDIDGPVITAVTSDDDVAFYRFCSVDLPVLL